VVNFLRPGGWFCRVQGKGDFLSGFGRVGEGDSLSETTVRGGRWVPVLRPLPGGGKRKGPVTNRKDIFRHFRSVLLNAKTAAGLALGKTQNEEAVDNRSKEKKKYFEVIYLASRAPGNWPFLGRGERLRESRGGFSGGVDFSRRRGPLKGGGGK